MEPGKQPVIRPELHGAVYWLRATRAGFRMEEGEHHLILIVCGDPQRTAAIRGALWAVGMHAARARTLDAAINLTRQVLVDGAVLAEPITPADAARLSEALNRTRQGSPRLLLSEQTGEGVPGWEPCPEAELPARLMRLLGP